MKKYTLLLLLTVMLCACTGLKNSAYKSVDERDVPKRYAQDLKKRCADATNVKWQMADSTMYFANFKSGDNDCRMIFTRTSTEMMYLIPMEYLPSDISDYVSANYPQFKIKEAYISDIKNKKYYRIEIAKKSEIKKLQFDLKGAFDLVLQ